MKLSQNYRSSALKKLLDHSLKTKSVNSATHTKTKKKQRRAKKQLHTPKQKRNDEERKNCFTHTKTKKKQRTA